MISQKAISWCIGSSKFDLFNDNDLVHTKKKLYQAVNLFDYQTDL